MPKKEEKPKIIIQSKVPFINKEPEPAQVEKTPLLRIIDKKPLEMPPPPALQDSDETHSDISRRGVGPGNKPLRPGFAITIGNKPVDGWYDVTATSTFSPGEEASGRFKIPFPEEYITETLNQLFTSVKHSRDEPVTVMRGTNSLSGDIVDTDQIPIELFGQQLYTALFNREVEELYVDAVDRATAQFPISIIAGAPEVARLPWEFIHDGKRFLCTDVGSVYRVIPDAPASAQSLTTTEPALRLLLVPTNIPGTDALDVEQEEENIRSTLKNTSIEIFKPTSQRIEDFMSMLLECKPHIIHFVGHGENDSILFKNRKGEKIHVGEVLGQMLLNTDVIPKVVILNACFTATASPKKHSLGLAAQLVQKRVPMVVAMQFAISDDAALAFSRGFYEYIRFANPIQRATAWGRLAIKAGIKDRLQVEWATPVVYANPSVILE